MEEKARKLLERIEEIEARAAKATPGPWTVVLDRKEDFYEIRTDEAGATAHIATLIEANWHTASFIAHAREDVPWLCQVIRGLLKEVREWICERCRYVYPEFPNSTQLKLQCPRCKGVLLPKSHWERLQVEAQCATLRKALQQMVDKCPICGGTGQNYVAKQAWDIPWVPTAECQYCAPARCVLEAEDAGRGLLDRLRKLEAVAEAAQDLVDDVIPSADWPEFDRLREALATLEAGPKGKDDAG